MIFLQLWQLGELGETRSERVEYKSFGRGLPSPHLSMLHRVGFVVRQNLIIQSTLDMMPSWQFHNIQTVRQKSIVDQVLIGLALRVDARPPSPLNLV